MESHIVTQAHAGARSSIRTRVIVLFGPAVVAGGLLWALIQPYRLTLLHPRGQGFWWLLIEPPLLVIAAGLFFSIAVARPLIDDLEEGHEPP